LQPVPLRLTVPVDPKILAEHFTHLPPIIKPVAGLQEQVKELEFQAKVGAQLH
jgi:hypothetical protein